MKNCELIEWLKLGHPLAEVFIEQSNGIGENWLEIREVNKAEYNGIILLRNKIKEIK